MGPEREELEGDRSPLSNAEDKNKWIYISTPHAP
jgi:hypothetical protein